ncbi:MAG: hypothetical protein BWX90_00180 [bacterium ADurb.Bin132]|nr:MAG: hypothetical protein BWX90_00180 [bacterium ADurb.Bin132]
MKRFFSLEIPIPVSFTSILIKFPPITDAERVISPPDSVYFAAFESMFRRISLSFVGSALTLGRSSGIFALKDSIAASNIGSMRLETILRTSFVFSSATTISGTTIVL